MKQRMRYTRRQLDKVLASTALRCKQVLAFLMVLVLMCTLACSQGQGTYSQGGDQSNVFSSEGGNVIVTVKPYHGLVQGDTVNFRVEVTSQHQVYLTQIMFKPENSMWYRWPPALLYRNSISWPEVLVAQEGGLDATNVKVRIPEGIPGPLEVRLDISYEFAQYMDILGNKYKPVGTCATIHIPLNLPEKPEAGDDALPLPSIGVPVELGHGATLAVDKVEVIGTRALLCLALDNTKSNKWVRPDNLSFNLMDKAGVGVSQGYLNYSMYPLAKEKYPYFREAKGEYARGWILFDISDLGQQLFLYFWDLTTMDTMAFIYLGEAGKAEPSQLFQVKSWKLVEDNGKPVFEVYSVQAHDCTVRLSNPEERWVEPVKLSAGEGVWRIPIETTGVMSGNYTLVGSESCIGVELNSATKEFSGARLKMTDAAFSLSSDEPYCGFHFDITQHISAKLSNTGDLPVYLEGVKAVLDNELSMMHFNPDVYIFPGEEFFLQESGSAPVHLEEYLTPGSKQVLMTFTPANCEPVSQVQQFQGPVLSIEHAKVTWFYSQADKAYMTTGLDISIHSSGDLPSSLETILVSADDRAYEFRPGIFIMPGESWQYSGSLFLSKITPGDKELRIEILAADGSVMDSYSEYIHLP